MRIGLYDSDHTGFPNYALMKISAWHKARGDTVEWWTPLCGYDRVYSSKIFTFSPENPYLPPDAIKGGTGYGDKATWKDLPQEIDDAYPDYTLYPDCHYAIGFLTRGCIRKCPWCIVPRKEGSIRPYRTWQEVKRPDSRDIVFMDNNVLACRHGREQIRAMIGQDVRVDFNQGMDARLMTEEVVEDLARLKWIRFIRMSADTDEMLDVVLDKIRMFRERGVKPHRIFVYVLVQDIESAERRCVALRDIGASPFAQPYRDFTTNKEPPAEQRRFAQWVNLKKAFMTVERFRDFDR